MIPLLSKGVSTGIFQMSNEAYHADRTAVSSSGLKEMLRSPAHFQAYLNTPHEETPTLAFGTAVHCAILEPDRFRQDYVVAIKFDRRTKEGKAQAEAFEAANAGKRIISSEEMVAIEKIVCQIQQHPVVPLLLERSVMEQSLFWVDPDTGVLCKCRPDALSDICIMDVKTACDASPSGFAKAIANFDYDLSAAFYIDGVAAVTGRKLNFGFVACEKEAPYAVAVYQADDEMIDSGRRKYKAALHQLAECRRTSVWPGYQPDGLVEMISLPRWAIYQ